MPTPKLILASRSPRRALLLRKGGFEFEQMDPPFHDPPQPVAMVEDAEGFAMELARAKAVSLAESLLARGGPNEQTLIIGADTVCVGVDGGLLGQPRDAADAAGMLTSFRGAAHDVVTGVALVLVHPIETYHPWLREQDVTCFADTAAVTFAHVPDETIDAYVAGGQWRGKAGGYNLFDRQQAGWPITVAEEVDPTTVVGLPMRKLIAALRAQGVIATAKAD